MSRRNYVKFAEAMKFHKPIKGSPGFDGRLYQWRLDVSVMADVFYADNPRFDRDRFLRAVNFSDES